jgi:hypothetical protein
VNRTDTTKDAAFWAIVNRDRDIAAWNERPRVYVPIYDDRRDDDTNSDRGVVVVNPVTLEM